MDILYASEPATAHRVHQVDRVGRRYVRKPLQGYRVYVVIEQLLLRLEIGIRRRDLRDLPLLFADGGLHQVRDGLRRRFLMRHAEHRIDELEHRWHRQGP